eukprot:TRINITY_DN63344_c1_g1_i1.p1 TRINITY_DN63344_c1_g1~~TRINITY_DN63344_c1_g1_i1.p1  ORF type:complete len:622 (-),score=104.31 TRINITY_DN63344_c1_g1_i1:36-1901(-)
MAAATHSSVPNYNIFGHQHNMAPFKDKRHLESQPIRHARWLDAEKPNVRSRAELEQARKRGRIPDPSYDFDGDGVVGQLDYFIGRSFDKDADGRLTRSERGQAEKALANGFLDKYMRGLDTTGDVGRGSSLRQKRGHIVAVDNGAEASAASYPPHFNAHNVPPHATRTALSLSRKAELKGYGAACGERWARACAPVREPQPPNSTTEPRTCPVAHIRERAEADSQAARARAGLLPMTAPVNPERENRMACGLDWQEAPLIATRSQLLETRKELMKRDCEELRAKGEDLFPPLSVRRAEKEAIEFEFRRPQGTPKTLTTLKDDRRRDRIEYDMTHFSNPQVYPREYPRYSDRPDVPFWVSDTDAMSHRSGRSAAGSSTQVKAMARAYSEPVLKVNEVPWQHETRELHSDLPEAAHTAGAILDGKSKPHYGSKTIKRFSADYIEHGQGRNKPRIFNQIVPLHVGPRDLEHLDVTSSMEPIRRKALLEQAEERKRNAVNPRTSRLWAEHVQTETAPPPVATRRERTRPAATVAATVQKPMAAASGVRDLATYESQREPQTYGNYSGPRLGNAGHGTTSAGVRCGGFQKLDWIPGRGGQTATGPVGRSRSETHMRSKEPAPAPPL